MLTCFAPHDSKATPIIPLTTENFSEWLSGQTDFVKTWVKALNFSAKAETYCILPTSDGNLSAVLFGMNGQEDFWSFGWLPCALPEGQYSLENIKNLHLLEQIVMAWGLGSYQFTRYKKSNKKLAQLVVPDPKKQTEIESIITAIYQVRDLINTPTENLGPEQLVDAVAIAGQKLKADVRIIKGQDLLKNNYPLIHAVGRASLQSPCLADLRWGDPKNFKLTLVGKGVCFDSGGLDLKNSASMLLMRKDMAGAAHVLGLAHMIITANLPIYLRVLIPAVENAVSANSYRPGDIITSRKGITVEIGNTDAEGRLILADALTEAVAEKPDLLLDFATLTGAARVAVGTDITAVFSNNDVMVQKLLVHAKAEQDPMCVMPLYAPYRKMLDSSFADINNASTAAYGGAITAALFLKEFVPDNIPWMHFDLMAWNLGSRPGRPEGGEAMAIRAVFKYLQETHKKKV